MPYRVTFSPYRIEVSGDMDLAELKELVAVIEVLTPLMRSREPASPAPEHEKEA